MYEVNTVNTDLGVSAERERDESASLYGAESEAYENWFTRCICVDEKTQIFLSVVLLPAASSPTICHKSRNYELLSSKSEKITVVIVAEK